MPETKAMRRTGSPLAQLIGGLLVIGALYVVVVITSTIAWAQICLGAAFVCSALSLKHLWPPARVVVGFAGVVLTALAIYKLRH